MIKIDKKTRNMIVIGLSMIIITSALFFYYLTNNTTKKNEYALNDSTLLLYTNSSENIPNSTVLGTDDMGRVLKIGPYGNNQSSTKIAYIIGVHAWENKSHQSIFDKIQETHTQLNNKYYVYIIDSKEKYDYNQSRLDGQILAKKYAIPDIKKEKYDLVIDVHSNRGFYDEKIFIFTAINTTKTNNISNYLIKDNDWLVYYVPPRSNEPTSAPYISEPLIRNKIPTIVYESYTYSNKSLVDEHAYELILSIDNYEF